MRDRSFHSKGFVFFLIATFLLAVASEGLPRNKDSITKEKNTPVVRVRKSVHISQTQQRRFSQLLEEGKSLYHAFDYQGAIEQMKKAHALAVSKEQISEVLFFLSLAYYATLGETGSKEFNATLNRLIEIDYYRELDPELCPDGYIKIHQETKSHYGVVKIRSMPAGAEVYLNNSGTSSGKTPLTQAVLAGELELEIKKGKKKKKATIQVEAGRENQSPVYELKGGSSTILILGGVLVAGGLGAALALGGSDPRDDENNIVDNTTPQEEYEFVQSWGSYGSEVSRFNHITDLDVDSQGYVYVVDERNYRIQKFNSSGSFILKWGSRGSAEGQFNQPVAVAVDNFGNVYVSDASNYCVQKFTTDGSYVTKWGSEGSGDKNFKNPVGIAVDSSGNVYVVDWEVARVQKFTSNGGYITQWGSKGNENGQFLNPFAIALDNADNVYVVDASNYSVQKFTSNGSFITKWGSEGSGDGQFNQPGSVAVDNSSNVYVTDASNYCILKFTSTGGYVTKWGSEGSGDGQFDIARGLAVDSSGNVFVGDNHRVQKFRKKTTSMMNSKAGASMHLQNRTFTPRLHFERMTRINAIRNRHTALSRKPKAGKDR